MKKWSKILIVCTITCGLQAGCDPADNRLRIINNSNHDVIYYISCDSILKDLQMCRGGYDINALGDTDYFLPYNLVRKESSENITKKGRNSWKRFVRNCKNNTITVFFFEDSVFKYFTDEEIISRRLYGSKTTINLDSLEKRDWTFEFP